jgi:hypothetical protein
MRHMQIPAYEMPAYEMHAYEIHAHETHAYEVYPDEMHARKMHARKMHARKMHAHEMHACEMHARKVHACVPGARLYVRYMSTRYTPLWVHILQDFRFWGIFCFWEKFPIPHRTSGHASLEPKTGPYGD